MENLIKQSLIILFALLLSACGSGDGNGEKAGNQSSSSKNEPGLTEFQMNHGIGPVTEAIILSNNINQEMAERGKEVFRTKCSACHKMDSRYVGPPLGNVLEDRTPAYVMNMILNPQEMTKKHPEAKKMLQEYMNQMTFQNVTRDDARAIVEYLRTQQLPN